ncbi:hypothetical protein C8D87_114110 [Lentzea atacamensis]|uniref:Uncharacterized protein n=1 Tax=Lentzea atacamensis TaxID=531938 RepID=A0ABX9DW27_9PSEU|nr:hypothetical protein [Lentzea atacamensis]RAS59498.1 hypothetical protein C8D87_114110 [Lentzea atacamensis]
MPAPDELVYDPNSLFAEVFSDPALAEDLAFAYSCREINAMVAQLEHHGRHDGAAHWLKHHLPACDDPRRHLGL